MCVNQRMMNPPGLNPHCLISGLDPPRFGERPQGEPPRRWECAYCKARGTMDELSRIECTHVYPPCKYCGETPECAQDCPGIGIALSGDDVHVILGPSRGSA
jgi:hypothetical protein